MASITTKAIFAIGTLDIARQVARAWSAKQRAERDRAGFGHGIRAEAAQLTNSTRRLARDAHNRLPDSVDWRGLSPWHSEPTRAERARTWAPVALVIALVSAAVVVVAHLIARQDSQVEPERAVHPRMTGVIKAGSEAIDAGVEKVVQGGSTATVGTASTVAAGTSAVKSIAVDRAKAELDERVVAPAKKKATTYGVLAILGLTIYIIAIAAIVQLVVEAIQ